MDYIKSKRIKDKTVSPRDKFWALLLLRYAMTCGEDKVQRYVSQRFLKRLKLIAMTDAKKLGREPTKRAIQALKPWSNDLNSTDCVDFLSLLLECIKNWAKPATFGSQYGDEYLASFNECRKNQVTFPQEDKYYNYPIKKEAPKPPPTKPDPINLAIQAITEDLTRIMFERKDLKELIEKAYEEPSEIDYITEYEEKICHLIQSKNYEELNAINGYNKEKRKIADEKSFFEFFKKHVDRLETGRIDYHSFRNEFGSKYKALFGERVNLEHKPDELSDHELVVDVLSSPSRHEHERHHHHHHHHVEEEPEPSIEVESEDSSFSDMGLEEELENLKKKLEIEKLHETYEQLSFQILELEMQRNLSLLDSYEDKIVDITDHLEKQKFEINILREKRQDFEKILRDKIEPVKENLVKTEIPDIHLDSLEYKNYDQRQKISSPKLNTIAIVNYREDPEESEWGMPFNTNMSKVITERDNYDPVLLQTNLSYKNESYNRPEHIETKQEMDPIMKEIEEFKQQQAKELGELRLKFDKFESYNPKSLPQSNYHNPYYKSENRELFNEPDFKPISVSNISNNQPYESNLDKPYSSINDIGVTKRLGQYPNNYDINLSNKITSKMPVVNLRQHENMEILNKNTYDLDNPINTNSNYLDSNNKSEFNTGNDNKAFLDQFNSRIDNLINTQKMVQT